MNSKARLPDQIRLQLREQFERLSQAARETHAAATDPGSKAEGKYDTRSLEASYLASGQARQVEETAEALRLFTSLTLPDFAIDQPIDAGALVELDLDGSPARFLLVPAGGGMVIEDEHGEITLLSPASALYTKLIGLRSGDSLEDPAAFVSEVG